MVGIDSFSRRHFYRKLPTTVNYLNKLRKNENYTVFDFKIHNVMGTDTAENLSNLFGK
jgi:hypothetical protein